MVEISRGRRREVAAGALIALGPSARLAVVVGTMVATIAANLLGDRNFWSAVVFALCNAGEALFTAGLIERYFGSGFSLNRLRDVPCSRSLECSRSSSGP
jgi:integral membrane sensor domain MASE1